jgi:hypothetical protein
VIADVDASIGQVPGDFGEEIRLLEGCERGVGLQPLSHRAAARMHNLDPWAANPEAGADPQLRTETAGRVFRGR